MDYEIQYSMTIDYVDRVLEANKDMLDVYRVCVPFRVTTCTSMYQNYWRPWDEAKKEAWVREMPEGAMTVDDSLSITAGCGTDEFQTEFPVGSINGKLHGVPAVWWAYVPKKATTVGAQSIEV